MSKFLEVSKAVQEASEGYSEVDENMHEMFLDTFTTFINIIKELQDGAYEDISSEEVKLAVFENIFNIDIKTAVLEIAEDAMKNRDENISDKNELNADKDLLASIRKNFDDYLKD